MGFPFVKMQGIGNDYIYLCFQESVPLHPERLAVTICNRHTGIGGDGLVLILPSETADFRMRIFNADGSEAAMCGNAARCIGKYVYEKGLTQKTELTLETGGGVRTLHLHVRQGRVETVTVNMGQPQFDSDKIPLIWTLPRLVEEPFWAEGARYRLTAVSMGNPHGVVFCPQPDSLALAVLGPQLEQLKVFPHKANIEFVRQTGPQSLYLRVWERGSGETLACGTGACAAVAAGIITGRLPKKGAVSVALPGGQLEIEALQDGSLCMTGPAEFVFEGKWCADDTDE